MLVFKIHFFISCKFFPLVQFCLLGIGNIIIFNSYEQQYKLCNIMRMQRVIEPFLCLNSKQESNSLSSLFPKICHLIILQYMLHSWKEKRWEICHLSLLQVNCCSGNLTQQQVWCSELVVVNGSLTYIRWWNIEKTNYSA